MRLWRIPSPWDYHRNGGYLILAETADDAVSQLKAKIAEDTARWGSAPYRSEAIEWDGVTEVTGIYEESGCDC